MGQHVYYSLIRTAIRREDDKEAWRLFDQLRGRSLPRPIIASTMLNRCAYLERPELAFKTWTELCTQGMLANAPCLEALIYAASKRTDYYARALGCFRELEALGLPCSLRIYNHMLQVAAKNADLATAISIWRKLLEGSDPAISPNEHSYASFLWSLASVETPEYRLSKNRPFVYGSIESAELIETAWQILDHAIAHGIPINGKILSAGLAIFSNNGCVESARRLWNEWFPKYNIQHSPFAYELMFKLFDTVRDWPRTAALWQDMQEQRQDKLLPYEGWRAMIRTAAL